MFHAPPKGLFDYSMIHRDLQTSMRLEGRRGTLSNSDVAGGALRSNYIIDNGATSLRARKLHRARGKDSAPRQLWKSKEAHVFRGDVKSHP